MWRYRSITHGRRSTVYTHVHTERQLCSFADPLGFIFRRHRRAVRRRPPDRPHWLLQRDSDTARLAAQLVVGVLFGEMVGGIAFLGPLMLMAAGLKY